jgi:hypothetical protein
MYALAVMPDPIVSGPIDAIFRSMRLIYALFLLA